MDVLVRSEVFMAVMMIWVLACIPADKYPEDGDSTLLRGAGGHFIFIFSLLRFLREMLVIILLKTEMILNTGTTLNSTHERIWRKECGEASS